MTTPNLENINVSAFDNMPTPAEIASFSEWGIALTIASREHLARSEVSQTGSNFRKAGG